MDQPTIEIEYPSLGPVSAHVSDDGSIIAIDFLSARDPARALRVALNVDGAAKLRDGLQVLLRDVLLAPSSERSQ